MLRVTEEGKACHYLTSNSHYFFFFLPPRGVRGDKEEDFCMGYVKGTKAIQVQINV